MICLMLKEGPPAPSHQNRTKFPQIGPEIREPVPLRTSQHSDLPIHSSYGDVASHITTPSPPINPQTYITMATNLISTSSPPHLYPQSSLCVPNTQHTAMRRDSSITHPTSSPPRKPHQRELSSLRNIPRTSKNCHHSFPTTKLHDHPIWATSYNKRKAPHIGSTTGLMM